MSKVKAKAKKPKENENLNSNEENDLPVIDLNILDAFAAAEAKEFFFFMLRAPPDLGHPSQHVDEILAALLSQSKADKNDLNSLQYITGGVVINTNAKNNIFNFCTENTTMDIPLKSKTVTFRITPTQKKLDGSFESHLFIKIGYRSAPSQLAKLPNKELKATFAKLLGTPPMTVTPDTTKNLGHTLNSGTIVLESMSPVLIKRTYGTDWFSPFPVPKPGINIEFRVFYPSVICKLCHQHGHTPEQCTKKVDPATVKTPEHFSTLRAQNRIKKIKWTSLPHEYSTLRSDIVNHSFEHKDFWIETIKKITDPNFFNDIPGDTFELKVQHIATSASPKFISESLLPALFNLSFQK